MRGYLARTKLLPFAIAILALLPMTASAHEHRDVADGQYTLIVGFLNEPAYSGEINGLDLRVSKADPTATPAADDDEAAGVPVEGLDATLQAEVIYGDQKMALPLSPRYNQPGAYASYFFPTQPGDYSFHIWGTIEGVSIDETFTSGPDTFGPMEDPAPLQFPKPASAAGNGSVSTAAMVGDSGGNSDGLPATPLQIATVGIALAGTWGVRRFRARRPSSSATLS